MRVQHQIVLAVSDDAAGLMGEFARSANLPATVLDGFTASASGTFYLPPDMSGVNLSLGDLAQVGGFYVEVDGATSVVSLEGGWGSLKLTPPEPGKLAHLFVEAPIAALTLASATVGQAVRGRYTIWGNTPALGTGP